MNATATPYELRLAGHLDDHWASWLGELTITRNDDGTTTVMALVSDQTQLHGVLARLRDIGATLLSLRTGEASGLTARPVLAHPLHTERLTIRQATALDADATWMFRRLESVNEWLTGAPADLAAYRAMFCATQNGSRPRSSSSSTRALRRT